MLGSKRVQCVFCELWRVSFMRCHEAVGLDQLVQRLERMRADMDVLTPLVLDLQTTVQGWGTASSGWRSQ